MAITLNSSVGLDDGAATTPPALTNGLGFHSHASIDPDARTITTYALAAQAFTEPVTGYSDTLVNDLGAFALHTHSGYIVDADIPAGSSTLDVTYSQAMDGEAEGHIYWFEGVDQTTPVSSLSAHTNAESTFVSGGATEPADMDLDVVSGDAVVFILFSGASDTWTFGGDWGGTINENGIVHAGGGAYWIGHDLISSTDANYLITFTKTGGNGGGLVQAFVIKGIGASNQLLSQLGTMGMKTLSGGFR